MVHQLLAAFAFLLLLAALPSSAFRPLRNAADRELGAPIQGAPQETAPLPVFTAPRLLSAEPFSPPGNPAQDKSGPHAGQHRALLHSSARLLAGPGDLSSEDFGAYGLLVFTRPPRGSQSTGTPDKLRNGAICEAFVEGMAGAPTSAPNLQNAARTVVTVWPMHSSASAARARAAPEGTACAIALLRYRMDVAELARRAAAGDARFDPTRRGPFLMAWQPGADFADPGHPVLLSDLSDVSTLPEARAVLARWDAAISAEAHYAEVLAARIGRIAATRAMLRAWADTEGAQALSAARQVFGLAPRLGSGLGSGLRPKLGRKADG